jgi:hypothetical protein
MSRGSKPGERRGGRQRGTPNKKTQLKNAAVDAAAANPNVSPLSFLLGLMRNEGLPIALRIDIAATAAPLFHAKPKAVAGNGRPEPKRAEDEIELVVKPRLEEGAFDAGVSPLELLQSVMTDPATPPQLRIRAARIAAPFRHGKPIEPVADTVEMISKDKYGFVVDQGFAKKLRDLVVAQWRTWYSMKEDEDINRQLSELRKKLPRPPLSYRDGQAMGDKFRMINYWADRLTQKHQLKLSAEEDAAISHACFRFLAFEQTWHGIGYYDHYSMCQKMYDSMKRAEMNEVVGGSR